MSCQSKLTFNVLKNLLTNYLASQGNKKYFLGDFNINLFFEGHYILKKSYVKLKEAQSNQRLLKLRDMFSFWFEPARSTLKTLSLLGHILTNSKESVTQHGVITLELLDRDFIFCTRKTKSFK